MKALLGKITRRFTAKAADRPPAIVVEGARKATGGKARNRVVMTMAVFLGIYGVIAGRLAYLGMQDPEDSGPPGTRVTASRPDIVDRNGEVLATDIKTSSLF